MTTNIVWVEVLITSTARMMEKGVRDLIIQEEHKSFFSDLQPTSNSDTPYSMAEASNWSSVWGAISEEPLGHCVASLPWLSRSPSVTTKTAKHSPCQHQGLVIWWVVTSFGCFSGWGSWGRPYRFSKWCHCTAKSGKHGESSIPGRGPGNSYNLLNVLGGRGIVLRTCQHLSYFYSNLTGENP